MAKVKSDLKGAKGVVMASQIQIDPAKLTEYKNKINNLEVQNSSVASNKEAWAQSIKKRFRVFLPPPVIIALVILMAGPIFAEEAKGSEKRSFAVRAGWAYGLGAEIEYRPGSWGVGISGGYVPGLGVGGYLGLQWGSRPIGLAGFVAEAGLFRGLKNPLRSAKTGQGVYALGGYAFAPAEGISIRITAGAGLPFAGMMDAPSLEFLAKITAGVVF